MKKQVNNKSLFIITAYYSHYC